MESERIVEVIVEEEYSIVGDGVVVFGNFCSPTDLRKIGDCSVIVIIVVFVCGVDTDGLEITEHLGDAGQAVERTVGRR